ncbi:MAG: MFS transporter [Thermodesulfobacteriota bacterium]
MENSSYNTPPLVLAWFIWSLGALLYLMGFFHRVAPAVMTVELMQDFNISAAALGNLSAFYFYSYVAMQIPTGIMADTLGPRRLLTFGSLVAGVGTAIFALAPSLLLAGFGRLLIGASVAVAWVAILKLASSWFPARYYTMMSGVALFIGIMGAVSAGPPLRLLVGIFDWRNVIMGSAVLMFAVAALMWFFVWDYPHERGFKDYVAPRERGQEQSLKSIFKGVLEVFRYRNTILLFIVPGGIVGSVLTFSGLWGVPFLSTHHGLTTTQASALTSTLMVAMAISGPVSGWFSDRIGRRKPLYICGAATALIGWIAITYLRGISVYSLLGLMIITGLSSGVMVVSFVFAQESVPRPLAGTIAGVINTGVMVGPMLLQPGVGWVLDAKWDGLLRDGVRVYGVDAFQSGFSLMFIWAGLSLILLLFTRETHCRQIK